jgi:hypothetical protein
MPTAVGNGTFSMNLTYAYDIAAAASAGANSALTGTKSATATIQQYGVLDVGTMTVVTGADTVNGANTSQGWLPVSDKDSSGAWLPLNTENNAYKFGPNGDTEIQDRNEPTSGPTAVSFLDDALLPIRITSKAGINTYSLSFDPSILRVFTNQDRTGVITPGQQLTVNGTATYWIEGIGGFARCATHIDLNGFVGGKWQWTDAVKVEIFTWWGPQDVPNYATYSYGASGGAPGSGWIGATGGVLSGPAGNTASILWNSPTAVVGMAEYRVAANYTWGYDVNVVAVNPSGNGKLLIKTSNGQQYMYANLPVAIAGPVVGNSTEQRGVKFIEAGYTQTLKFTSQHANYTSTVTNQPAAGLEYFNKVSMEGQTVPDAMTYVHSANTKYASLPSILPWACSGAEPTEKLGTYQPYFDGQTDYTPGNPVGNGGIFTFTMIDIPYTILNFDPKQNPVIGGKKQYLCDSVDLVWDYVTYLTVHTTESVGEGLVQGAGVYSAQNVYTERASATWDYIRVGTYNYHNPTFPKAHLGMGSLTFTAIVNGTVLPAWQTRGPVANTMLTGNDWEIAP